MAFVNEVVSDADIDKYGLPFPKGGGRYWTRDAERDLYLWGGKGGNPAFGEEILGYFSLYIKGVTLRMELLPGHGSRSYSDSPFVIEWEALRSIDPWNLQGLSYGSVVQILKEALTVYGDDGRENKHARSRQVRFHF
jgi:hypothetical protein